ncbi:glycosyltransferase [Eubacterium aggregans]|uniref:glycosyltransferase n=1 Tax=Eubacterium aggregans TaxID=81409 RepID=UPI003F2D0DF4
MPKKEKISFVIPCYRSEQTITAVVKDIKDTVRTRPEYDYEIILVNDGSPDDTYSILQQIAAANPEVVVVNLMRNFGQASAIMAGYHEVTGDLVINLDDDGQTDPKPMFTLVDRLKEGYDVVYALYDNKHHSWFRNFGSKINDIMADHLIGKPRNLVFTSYFCAIRKVIDEVVKYDKPYPYVDGLVIRITRNVSSAPIHHKSREAGESGYTFGKLISLWLDGFTAFSVKPLRIATILGFVISLLGFIYGIHTIVMQFVNPSEISGWPSLISAVVFLGGVNMVLLGLVGEYVGRVYISMNNTPQFIVRNVITQEVRHERDQG